MKGPKRVKLAEAFDVTDFLRPDDQDLRSALASLMGVEGERVSSPEPPSDVLPGPGPNLVPGPELEPPVPAASPLKSGPGPNSVPGLNTGPGINLGPGLNLMPPVNLGPGPDLSAATVKPVESRRQYPLRRAQSAEEGHSRGEQTVYDAMWRDGEEQADGTRLLRIGMLGLARRAGMSESNVRVNLRGLVQKLAVEEETSYVCEAGQGRTWRVFSSSQALERRRQAGMEWYRKRTLAVVFEEAPDGAK